MKRLLHILILLFVISIPSSCVKINPDPSIKEGSVAKSIDRNTSAPSILSSTFSQSEPVIYFVVKVEDLPKDTLLKAVWKYAVDGTEVTSEVTTSGTHYEAFTLKRSGSRFPAGQYEVTVTGNAKGKLFSAKGNFEITPEVNPTHLLNPVIAKEIDSEDKLSPMGATSEFTQKDEIIYFIVQSKELPKDTKISCVWYYKETGDRLSHELITEGSRNIAFTLKPDKDQKLPAGKYMVRAMVTINNQTESVEREFEVKQS
jgi:hypothetical protein